MPGLCPGNTGIRSSNLKPFEPCLLTSLVNSARTHKVAGFFYSATAKALPMKSQADLLDLLIDRMTLNNDAGLARALDTSPSAISKIRSATLPIGPSILVRMHEASGLTIAQLREAMGLPGRMYIHG